MATSTPRTRFAHSTITFLTLLLVLTLVPPAASPAAAQPVPVLPEEPAMAAEVAAGWLALQLVEGERLEGQFGPDVGLTADAVFALAAAGVAEVELRSTIDWLSTQVAGYTQGVPFDRDDAVYAGATAKLLLALLVGDRDVRDVGGVDLVGQLEEREQEDGRFTDRSSFGDFSSTLTQSLAVLALARAEGVSPSAASISLLLDQQCDDGGFRFDPDAADCSSSVDTTGFAVQALLAVGDPDATTAATRAAAWLVEVQDDAGAHSSDDGRNANSTALAALALLLAPDVPGGQDAQVAARSYLLSLRTGCEGAFPGAFPFTAEDPGDVARATAQVIPSLAGIGLASVSAASARPDVPALLPFTDVAPGGTHAPAICDLAARGAIRGFDARTFRPSATITRAQAASVLAELLGREPLDGQPFTDVPSGSRHAGAIAALAEAGILTGFTDGSFRPADTLRRDQAASLLARALELSPSGSRPFSDVTQDSVHADSIAALAEAGIAIGTSPTTFAPTLELRRDQFASLLHRSFPADASGPS